MVYIYINIDFMRKLSILVVLLFVGSKLIAVTPITTPTVSGHWMLAGSPYHVFNDISLPLDSTLTIDPGVEVEFQGNYLFTVNGNLTAAGTASQMIDFHVKDTTGWSDTGSAGGWGGIEFSYITSHPSYSVVDYCNFYDMKDLNGVGFYNSSFTISNCNFYHNKGMILSTYATDSTQIMEVVNCTFHNNIGGNYGIMLFNGHCNFHGNKVYSNVSNFDILYFTEINNLLFENNEVYQNIQLDSTFATSIEIRQSKATIRGNKIHHNTSQFVAALACYDGFYDIDRNLICNNQSMVGYIGGTSCGAIQGGGGIRISGEDATNPTYFIIRNNVIANNYAGLAGGGIYAIWANATISNNTIINNTGLNGGGIYVFNSPSDSDSTMIVIKNNILKNNYSITGASSGNHTVGLWLGNCYKLQYEKNWTEHPFYADYFAAAPFILLGDPTTNMVGTDPNLIDPTLTYGISEDATGKNFGLLSTSSCIDAGDTAMSMTGSLDYAGNVRIWGARIDMGAYEYINNSDTTIPTILTTFASIITPQMAIYPNPASNHIFVSLPEANGILEFRDAAGRKVLDIKVTNTLGSYDLNGLQYGVYTATWVSEKGLLSTQKIEIL